MSDILLIPFNHCWEVDQYAKQHNIKKYTGMLVPARGKDYPKKFLIVIQEKIENKPSFVCDGLFFDTFETMQYVKNIVSKLEPVISWKLIDGNYILIRAESAYDGIPFSPRVW